MKQSKSLEQKAADAAVPLADVQRAVFGPEPEPMRARSSWDASQGLKMAGKRREGVMATQPTEGRPEEIGGVDLEDAFAFLDMLRESGVTNMYGAGTYLREEYGCSKVESHKILAAWMQDFGK